MNAAAEPALRTLRDRGFELHERGDLKGAESIYREVLQRSPDDTEVNAALGVVALQTGRYETAVEIFAAAVAARETADANCYLGNALAGLARLQDALHRYDRAIALVPDFVPAHLNRGHALRHLRRYEEALASYDRVIDLRPRFFEALVARAEVFSDINRWPQAIADYDSAIAVRPEAVLTYVRRGALLLKAGRLGEALGSYQEALKINPEEPEAWKGCATTLLELKRPAESLACVDRALALRRPFPAAWFARAGALEGLGRLAEAFEAVETAIAEQPDHVKALVCRGNLWLLRGDFRAAIEDFRKAQERDPTFGPARIGTVIAQIPVVPASVEESLASREAFREALVRLATDLRSYPCTAPTSLVGLLQPYYLAYQEQNNRELLALYGGICAQLMGSWQSSEGITCSPVRAIGSSKVRVAIVSGHVRAHSVYHALTRGWLQHLDRRRFEVHVFHTAEQHDAETRTARTLADYYEDGGRSALDWAWSIQACRPDVILYPEIGMDRMSVQLASQRLAAVQVASWGHPQTTGLPTMDYFVSAHTMEPAGAASHYTERLVRLPNLGCYYERFTPSSEAADAITVAPPGSGPNLVCAGMPFKYAPEHDWVLVKIARRLGRCQLHLFSSGDGCLTDRLIRRLSASFSQAGLDSARYLVVHPWATLAQFHAFLRGADLMLDTIGFSGFNTVLQALECNLPVITHRGRFLRGRFGMGLLERVGLEELVAETLEDYIGLVQTLAGNERELDRVRDRIRTNLPKLYCDSSSLAGLETFLIEAVDSAARPRESNVRGL
jgi:protein O-GlcNAc transferase